MADRRVGDPGCWHPFPTALVEKRQGPDIAYARYVRFFLLWGTVHHPHTEQKIKNQPQRSPLQADSGPSYANNPKVTEVTQKVTQFSTITAGQSIKSYLSYSKSPPSTNIMKKYIIHKNK